MSKSRKKPNSKRRGGGNQGKDGRKGKQGGGNVSHRTKPPADAKEAKEAIASDLRTVLTSYVQNDLFPETALARQNIRLVLGVSGTDSLKEFLKSQEENYQDRTPVTEDEIENKSEHGEVLQPKAKPVTKLQEYKKNTQK